MKRACEQCGRSYVAKAANSRFCGNACRQKAARIRARNDPSGPVSTTRPRRNGRDSVASGSEPASIAEAGEIARATRLAFETANVIESPLALAALSMARRLDAATQMTGSAHAALDREFRAMYPLALQTAKAADDPIDQIAQRRQRRRAGA